MGQVYLATDTRLKRQVAIKIVSPALVADIDRLARFRREAELLASLNHPHIATIYGVEESGDLHAIVMEFVQGTDLSDRIGGRPMPLDEVVPIARQIVDALEAAHDHGIIHRDLKPANIKVRDDGTAKVLDFGLAKMLDPHVGAPPSSVSQSPTITTPGVTQQGVVLGTAAYMSPEQARGKAADRRSDVWAFGCVLYEMLTGVRAFRGDDVADVLAAVLRGEPDWTWLPRGTPEPIRRLLRRALTKDRRHRLGDMSSARLELDEAIAAPPRDDPAARPSSARWLAWAAIAVVALAVGVVIGRVANRGVPTDDRIVRFDIAPPPGATLDFGQPISPDGRHVAIVGRLDGQTHLWVRPLEGDAMRFLPDTSGATRSFWSPDSTQIAFFDAGDLKAVDVRGISVRLVTRGPFRDGAWSTQGVILVGGQQGRPLMRVSERGGDAVAETTLDESVGEVSHDYPEFLPDGRHYVYMSRRRRIEDFTTYIGRLGSTERQELPGIRTGVKYSSTGHLLFLRGNTLMAQAFDPERRELSGEPFPVAERAAGGRVAPFSVSADGTLAYVGGFTDESTLTWFDRAGKELAAAGPLGVYALPALSPDARTLSFDRGGDVWTMELEDGRVTRITSERATDHQSVWSPDGASLAYASDRSGTDSIYIRTLGAASGVDRLVMTGTGEIALSDWSSDGKYLAYSSRGDVWVVPVTGGEPLQVTTTPFSQEFDAVFSPDGRWLAYASDESTGITRSGQEDIFVQSFPQAALRRQVSHRGGRVPRWSQAGSKLFFLAPDGMLMSATVMTHNAGIDVAAPQPLFRARFNSNGAPVREYAVTRDGRFLIRTAPRDLSVAVTLNWVRQMAGERRTPAP